MRLSPSISGHTLAMESLKLGPRVKTSNNFGSWAEFRKLHHQGVARGLETQFLLLHPLEADDEKFYCVKAEKYSSVC